MKHNLILPIVCLLLGIIIGVSIGLFLSSKATNDNEDAQVILDNSRLYMIEFNKEYNKLYNDLGILVIGEDNDYARLTIHVLQKLTPDLIKINKSLKLDCKKYQDGNPLMIEDKYGNKNPLEILPEEIRIMK